MIRVLFTGEAQFLSRHRLLLDAIEKRGFDVAPLDLRSRGALSGARYAWNVGKYLTRSTALRGSGSLAARLSAHEVKAAFDRSPEAFAHKSHEFERAIRRAAERPHAIVHIFGLSSPLAERDDVPFAHYLDYTYALALRRPAMNALSDSARGARRFMERERRSYERAATLFTMSRFVRASLIDDYGIPPEKITVVGAGANIAIPETHERTFGSRRVLFNASDFTRKGGDVALAAFERLHAADASITLVTVGARLPGGFAARPGVEDRGAVSPGEMRDLYATSDVLLAPALADPFPGVAIEALAHGTPVIASDRDGLPEIVTDDHDGIVLGEADSSPDGVAAATRALLDDDARLRRYGVNARRTVAERLNWDVVAERMEPFFLAAAPA